MFGYGQAPRPARGGDILVRVEKMLDDAARTLGKTSSTAPAKSDKSSSALAFPENYVTAAGDQTPPTPAPRKN